VKPKEEIKRHRLPCGPLTVKIDGVCRRRLRDSMDRLLDRLTSEIHPEGRDPEQEHDPEIAEHEEKALEQKPKQESRAQKKKKMIEAGKLRAEVSKEVAKYKEKLMGNSKLLQDPTGKIQER